MPATSHGKPVTVLGSAIFNLEGLTFNGPLDRFWQEKQAPDADLFRAFRRVVISKAQVNGSFFTHEGLDLALANTLERLAVAPVTQPATQPRPAASGAPVKAPALAGN